MPLPHRRDDNHSHYGCRKSDNQCQQRDHIAFRPPGRIWHPRTVPYDHCTNQQYFLIEQRSLAAIESMAPNVPQHVRCTKKTTLKQAIITIFPEVIFNITTQIQDYTCWCWISNGWKRTTWLVSGCQRGIRSAIWRCCWRDSQTLHLPSETPEYLQLS